MVGTTWAGRFPVHMVSAAMSQSTSEWLCTSTGLLRSQYAHLAVDQLIASINSILRLHSESTSDSNSKNAVAPSLLFELSELVVSIVHLPKALPIVEALLQVNSGSSNLSDKFLAKVTALQRGYTNTTQLLLSYESRLALWTAYLPSFEQELLDLVEAVRATPADIPGSKDGASVGKDALKTLLESRGLAKACVDCPKLFIYAEEVLRVLFLSSCGAAIVVKLIGVLSTALAEAHHKQVLRSTVCPQISIEQWFGFTDLPHRGVQLT